MASELRRLADRSIPVQSAEREMLPSLILHVPHSSKLIPEDERASLVVDDGTLARELLRMTDAFTDDLFSPSAFEFARIVFPISRLICDVERFPEDDKEPMAARGMGAVYVSTTEGRPLRGDLPASERDRIMRKWYMPHHEALTTGVDEMLALDRSCTVIDCHSFSSVPLPHEPDQEPRRPDICIGTDDFHTPPALRDALAIAASAVGLSVAVNRPFAGALVPQKHHHATKRVKAVMIEVNRRLYMDEHTGNRISGFDNIRRALSAMLAAAAHCTVA